jgi:hypothetical protein
LFAARLQAASRVVENVNDERVRCRAVEKTGDIEDEGGASARVRAGELSVDPDARPVVACTHVQANARRRPRRGNRERAAIPDVSHEAAAREARELALAAEWHGDAIGECSGAREESLIAIIVGFGEIPDAVQAHPLGALHLRERVLGSRDRVGGACAGRGREGRKERKGQDRDGVGFVSPHLGSLRISRH